MSLVLLSTLTLIIPIISKLNQQSTIKFVNTSMHGVSDSFAMQAFTIFGFRPYIPVNEQQFPDPEFPTVHFPNPEEKGEHMLNLSCHTWLCLYLIHISQERL